ncbi:MAG: UDP-N-acetylmuramoyl-L-alanyl-D-glutamate--2,6-diaminopimelate ligase [Chloroflexi bacterium]|nr:UDP-N-acetylmuramoyl-L-alanyl-D-glutamate--2,6-diaminopimelate ligase [Chloroflexota bacterium]
MRISDLEQHLPGSRILGDAAAEFDAVSYDSRSVSTGSLFVAIPGFHVDGHDFLDAAIAAGAGVLCVQADHEAKWRSLAESDATALLVVPDARAALATISAALNGFPARKLNVIGVTGTDGKTSLSHLVTHVFETAGERSGLISTAECRIGAEVIGESGRFTTPESPDVQAMLATMVDRGCRWAVIEATSHGLALNRLDNIEPDIAVVTNVGADHLDFHGSVEEYVSAKGRLFEMLDHATNKGVQKVAVLNRDDPSYALFRDRTSAHIVTYGIEAEADVRAIDIAYEGWASVFTVRSDRAEFRVKLPSPGSFNVYNALATTAIGSAAGLDPETIVRGLESWPGAPGRMQLIDEGQPFTVVVDFAHSRDSLRRVLKLLRERASGRVIAVFGCIGERERERRAGMGNVAAELADFTIVTDDNPYTEDRDTIIAEIAEAIRSNGKREGDGFEIIPDRREAIARALHIARDGDTVLLAGKGHEKTVVMTKGSYACNDAEVARSVLQK